MKNFTLFVFALFAFSLFSCQDESGIVIQDTTNNFTKTSPISSLISRVSQYETTADNVLDGTSNCSIKLPAHVTVNNEYVYVISEADFQAVQDIKDQSNSDDDKVHFGFPITIVHPNYHEYTITSETQFDGILAGYGDDSSCHEVSCLDFNYPISVNLYNTDNQVASTVTIQSDIQLYGFIHNLNDSQIVGIVFPITLTNSSSDQITINNNAALEDAINDAVSNCNPAPSPTSLSDILTTGIWHISYCFYGYDATYLYNGYNFTFNANGTSIAVKNATTIQGDWDINNGMPQRLDLHFDGSQLHDLETNWDVQEFTSTFIRLRQSSGSNGYYLSFIKN
jgi:hypothetical protein